MSETNRHSSEFEARYDRIDTANISSWYLNEPRRFEAYQSVGTLKPAARLFGENAIRHTLAGNMSPLYGDEDEADANMRRFYASLGLAPGELNATVMLKPQRQYDIPLKAIEADDYSRAFMSDARPAMASDRADFLYTYNPRTILAARPADCPIVLATAATPRGDIMMLTHFAWQGAASGFVGQMFERYDELGVDRESLRLYVTPGGQAESFPYTGADYDPRERYPLSSGLFVNVHENDGKFDFKIDTPHFVYAELLKGGLSPQQIFADTSDTSRLDSGYSSHGRAARSGGSERNIRDIIIAKMYDAKQNPERPAPQEIIAAIKAINVEYIDFDGETQQGTIEVHEDVAKDVFDFFYVARETRFPIERIVRSSDPEFVWDDDRLMAANTSSGFNYRLIKGTDRPSLHGLGRAFDVNTRLNPYVRYVDRLAVTDPKGSTYSPDVPGTLSADHPLVVFMKERGWTWGGDWTEADHKVTDYQHFEKRM